MNFLFLFFSRSSGQIVTLLLFKIAMQERAISKEVTNLKGTEDVVILLLNAHVPLEHQLYLLLDCFAARHSSRNDTVTVSFGRGETLRQFADKP